MSFFSLKFIVFIIITFVIYYAIPARFRNALLLIASYVFYALWDLKYVAVMLIITAVSYLAGAYLSRARKKSTLIAGISFCIFVLVLFKFWHFWMDGITKLFGASDTLAGAATLVAPIGLSFYVLEAVGYMVDVYRGTVEREESVIRYALFLSFFPKVISGPIERSTNLLKQLHEEVGFNYDRVRHGLLMMLWGYLLKLMIADRAAFVVNALFDSYEVQSGMTMLIAVVLYGIQLYSDFAGYSLIAIGLGETLGFEIMANFRQPYLAVSVRDFWSRWHISLSTWLRDYIYIPLGGNRHGTARKYLNLMITFLVSGAWHGTGKHFLVWGALHGIYQVAENIVRDIKKKRSGESESGRASLSAESSMPAEASAGAAEQAASLTEFSKLRTDKSPITVILRILQSIWIFILVDYAWLFFRADSTAAAIRITRKFFTDLRPAETFSTGAYMANMSRERFIIMLVEIAILLVVDILRERKVRLYERLTHLPAVARWSVYATLVLLLLLVIVRDFGLDASAFIYAQF